MSLISDMLAAANRLLTFYNGDEKTAANPGGMTGVGGMADNWDPCIRDIGTAANGVGAALTSITVSESNAVASAVTAGGSATSAAGSASAAHADRLAADADAVATAADRAAVAADKTAVHADRVAADADAVATAADRTAVAADKTATHTDRLAADADAVATAADRQEVADNKALVAQDRQTVHDDRVLAEAARMAAQGYAAGLNLPAISAPDAGKALIVNPAGTGYLTGQAGLPAATGAEAAAGTSTTKAVTPEALAGWLPNLALLASANISKDTDRIPLFSATANGMRWVKPAFLGSMALATKTGNYTAIGTDNAAGLKFTAASTLTLPAASTLPADWAVTVLARSTGGVLIVAAGSDTVAGSAAFTLRSGQDCRITRSGTTTFEVTAVGASIYDSLAAWDPNAKGTGVVLSNNNLTATFGNGGASTRATIGASAGKRYFEAILTAAAFATVGVARSTATLNGAPGVDANGWAYLSDGRKYTGGTATAYGSSVSDGGRVRVAHNADTGQLWFAVGATWQGGGDPVAGTAPTFTGVTGTLFPVVGDYGGGTPTSVVTGVFAATSFAVAPPTGYSPYI